MIRFLRLFLIATLGLWVGPAGAVEITHGPELILGPSQAIIRWTTDTESGSRVQFGKSPGRLDRRADGKVGTEHLVELKDLQPGTQYHYTAGTARVPLVTNTFTTPALSGAATGPAPVVTPAGPDLNARTDLNPVTSARPPPARVTWGSLRSLQDHFDRHGADFDARDPEDYAAQAWLFLVKARAEGFPAKRDNTGVVRVYDPKTGAFAAFNKDGTTRTYFKPGRRDYFKDQPGEPVNLSQLRSFQPPR